MIGVTVLTSNHKLSTKVEPRLNDFCLKIEAGASIVEIHATSAQIEQIGRVCLDGLKDVAVKEVHREASA